MKNVFQPFQFQPISQHSPSSSYNFCPTKIRRFSIQLVSNTMIQMRQIGFSSSWSLFSNDFNCNETFKYIRLGHLKFNICNLTLRNQKECFSCWQFGHQCNISQILSWTCTVRWGQLAVKQQTFQITNKDISQLNVRQNNCTPRQGFCYDVSFRRTFR